MATHEEQGLPLGAQEWLEERYQQHRQQTEEQRPLGAEEWLQRRIEEQRKRAEQGTNPLRPPKPEPKQEGSR